MGLDQQENREVYMLKLSKKMLFAIEAVLDIAYHAGDLPVQNRDIVILTFGSAF